MDFIVSVMPRIAAFLTSVFVFFNSTVTSMSPQMKTMESVTEFTEGFYVMDCAYDYDALEILEDGIDNTVDLIAGGLKTIFSKGRNFGCSTFNSVTKQGYYLLSRNFDYMDSPAILVRTTPRNGYASISTVSLYFIGYELRSELKKTRGVTSVKQAMNILDKVHIKDEDLHGYICSTLWSNVFNMSRKTVSVCCFGNYNRTYTFSVSKPLLEQVKK